MKKEIKRGTIKEFVKEYNLNLEVSPYTKCFVVHFTNCAYIEGPEFPLFTTGIGETEEEAIVDYASKISGAVLVFDDRHLVQVWHLI